MAFRDMSTRMVIQGKEGTTKGCPCLSAHSGKTFNRVRDGIIIATSDHSSPSNYCHLALLFFVRKAVVVLTVRWVIYLHLRDGIHSSDATHLYSESQSR